MCRYQVLHLGTTSSPTTTTRARRRGCRPGLTECSGSGGSRKVLLCSVLYCIVLYCTVLSPWPGIPLESWTEPRLVFYGRAELKQSDHRPVIAVVDVQVGVTMMVMIMIMMMVR